MHRLGPKRCPLQQVRFCSLVATLLFILWLERRIRVDRQTSDNFPNVQRSEKALSTVILMESCRCDYCRSNLDRRTNGDWIYAD